MINSLCNENNWRMSILLVHILHRRIYLLRPELLLTKFVAGKWPQHFKFQMKFSLKKKFYIVIHVCIFSKQFSESKGGGKLWALWNRLCLRTNIWFIFGPVGGYCVYYPSNILICNVEGKMFTTVYCLLHGMFTFQCFLVQLY